MNNCTQRVVVDEDIDGCKWTFLLLLNSFSLLLREFADRPLQGSILFRVATKLITVTPTLDVKVEVPFVSCHLLGLRATSSFPLNYCQ